MTSPAHILIAPASFKGTLSALQAAQIMADAIKDLPASEQTCPLADGGDDTLAVLTSYDTGFQSIVATVNGPLPEQQVDASYLVHMQKRLVVIEAAQAHGLVRVPKKESAAMEATSYGVGELMLLAQGITAMAPDAEWTLLVTLGGSASTDGGVGALQALGYRFYGEQTTPLKFKLNASSLSHIQQIFPPHSPFPDNLTVRIASDVHNPLLGLDGCAKVFAPQKGAGAADVEYLERELTRFTQIVKRDLNKPYTAELGSGAAGGLAYGLSLLPHANIISGAQWIGDFLQLPEHIASSRLIVTGEGSFDSQSLSGKGTGQLIEAANGKPVFVFCGQHDSSMPLPDTVHVYPLVNDRFNINEAMYEPEKALQYAISQALPQIQNLLDL